MEEELKECPFCGYKHIAIIKSQIIPQRQWQAYCIRCGCGTMGHPNKEKVIMTWNKRVK